MIYQLKDMGKVPPYTVATLIPAGLYFFHHTVASQMAQQKEFNFKNPSAYHRDLLLLGFMNFLCGLIGVLLQMVSCHSPLCIQRSWLFSRQLIRKRMVRSAKESIKRQASNSEIFINMQAVFIEIDSSPDTTVAKKLDHLKEAVMRSTEKNRDKAEVTFDTIGESIVGSSI
ncbi:hypothetical protein P3S67_015141 [Capsicum chacoense]